MKHEVEAHWLGKMRFDARIGDHTVAMDVPVHSGGDNSGPSPKPFILASLAGCTGLDVVAILTKQGRKLETFNLKVTGELSKKRPVEYVAAHVTYEITGSPDDKQAVIEAVTASQEELCGVGHMLKHFMPVTWQIIYNGNEIFNNRA